MTSEPELQYQDQDKVQGASTTAYFYCSTFIYCDYSEIKHGLIEWSTSSILYWLMFNYIYIMTLMCPDSRVLVCLFFCD